MFLVLKISKHWHFLTSSQPPPYKCLRYIWMVPRQYRTGPAGPRKKDHCPLSYLPYLHNTGTLCPSLICYLGKKSVSGIVKHCTESAPHSVVQWCVLGNCYFWLSIRVLLYWFIVAEEIYDRSTILCVKMRPYILKAYCAAGHPLWDMAQLYEGHSSFLRLLLIIL